MQKNCGEKILHCKQKLKGGATRALYRLTPSSLLALVTLRCETRGPELCHGRNATGLEKHGERVHDTSGRYTERVRARDILFDVL